MGKIRPNVMALSGLLAGVAVVAMVLGNETVAGVAVGGMVAAIKELVKEG